MIEARDVTIAIGGARIVTGTTFSADPGKVTVIAGPNGSGKTTLLRAVSGDLAYAGQITLNGRELRTLHSAEAAAMRAVLPQSTALSFPFTVREIVRMGLVGGFSGATPAEERRLPDRALERVDLAGFEGRLYQHLSGGEQQRVQLARILCQVWAPMLNGRPRWLLLDEPISSLDIRHQIVIMNIAREFAAGGGGVVAILHDLNLAAMYADAVLLMRRGEILAAGPPRKVIRDDLIEAVFECRLRVNKIPQGDAPFVLPQSLAEAAAS